MEIKSIVVPDGWECIVKNGVATFQEKKENIQNPPRSWEEFCEKYPIQTEETFIDFDSSIIPINYERQRKLGKDRNQCISKTEAEAFLALMQLRQLRKAWVGDWEQPSDSHIGYILYDIKVNRFATGFGKFSCFITLSFPSCEMAEDFLSCFKDLCEKAKILL